MTFQRPHLTPLRVQPVGVAAELQLLIDCSQNGTVTLTTDFASKVVTHLTYWQRHQAEVADHAERAAQRLTIESTTSAQAAESWRLAALAYQEQRDQALARLAECQAPTLRGVLRTWWRAHVVG